MKYLKSTANYTSTDEVLSGKNLPPDGAYQDEGSVEFFFQDFGECLNYKTSQTETRNTDYGSPHDLSEGSQFFGFEEGRKYADTYYSGSEHQRKLIAYEKDKTLLFKMLTTNFPDSSCRSALTLVREFIGSFSFWTANIETHADKINQLLKILDKRVRRRSYRGCKKTSAPGIGSERNLSKSKRKSIIRLRA